MIVVVEAIVAAIAVVSRAAEEAKLPVLAGVAVSRSSISSRRKIRSR